MHDLYAALLRRARDENRGVTPQDRAWLISLAQERLRKLNQEMPAATAEILERESRDFLADVELFLEEESRGSGSTPIGFEVAFGRPLGDDDNEPLARSEPVEVDLGDGITFRIAGRIDRIDQVGNGEFEVLDYKTGGYWPDSWQGVFRGGSRLQHALYGLAAAELLKTRYTNPKIIAGVYYFSSHKGRLERVRIPTPARPAIEAVLGDLRDLIIKGEFIRTADDGQLQVLRLRRSLRRRSEPAGASEAGRSQAWGIPEADSACLIRVPSTSESRRLIREELQTNILVEAGAGSGKTQMLAERMAAGVAAGVYPLENMAAVTFTRKAASELRGRFHLALEAELSRARTESGADGAGPSDRIARIELALSNLESFFAGTIHSFCARLLRERPVESGVAPGFTELDETQDFELRQRAWRDFITGARAIGDPDMMALMGADVRPKDLDAAFATICVNDDVDFPAGTAVCPDPKPH